VRGEGGGEREAKGERERKTERARERDREREREYLFAVIQYIKNIYMFMCI